jgi:hypothetical protein
MVGDIEVTSNSAADNPDDAFLQKAKERYERAREYWNPLWEKAKDAHKFYGGDQWPQMAKLTRMIGTPKERPMMVVNRLSQFHNQIVNDYRQSTIGMKAIPKDTEHVPTAEAYEGLFRQIEKQSFAQVAYIKALSDGSIGGVGFIGVETDYESDTSFNQEIYIRRFTSPFVNYPDPDARGFFLEDSEYWFVLQKCSQSAYKEEFGDKESSSWDSVNADDKDDIILAQYWYFEYRTRTLILFVDGSTEFEDEVDKDHQDFHENKVKSRRKVRVRELKWALLDGDKVLDHKDWPKPRIPIVPVWGNEQWVDEKRVLTGFVENAKDPCRVYNYMTSAMVEAIGLAPKAPYIAEEGQLEGHEDDWNSAATTPKSVLKYKAVSVDGHIIGAPQRNSYEAPIAAIVQAGREASDNMKATIGMYDASLGQRSNETSGLAIEKRKREGDVATYNFVDNLAISVGYLGLIVGELIPVYYDTARSIRAVDKMGAIKNIKINDPSDENSPKIANVLHDLVLDTGPSFQTQRDETAQTLIELSHNFPKLMEVAGDIAVGNMNFSGAAEIAARLKRTLPPAVVGDDADPEAKAAALQQQLDQGKKVVEELTAKVAELEHANSKMELQLANRSGEIGIKQAEIAIKRRELDAKLEALADEGKKGDHTHESLAAVAEALIEFGKELEVIKDMITEAAHTEAAPEAGQRSEAEEATPAAEPANNAPEEGE